jgi:hypothetical protein
MTHVADHATMQRQQPETFHCKSASEQYKRQCRRESLPDRIQLLKVLQLAFLDFIVLVLILVTPKLRRIHCYSNFEPTDRQLHTIMAYASFRNLKTQWFPPAPTFTDRNIPEQKGKVFIVTGGNSGVGYALVNFLYSTGATIYMASRSKVRVIPADSFYVT